MIKQHPKNQEIRVNSQANIFWCIIFFSFLLRITPGGCEDADEHERCGDVSNTFFSFPTLRTVTTTIQTRWRKTENVLWVKRRDKETFCDVSMLERRFQGRYWSFSQGLLEAFNSIIHIRLVTMETPIEKWHEIKEKDEEKAVKMKKSSENFRESFSELWMKMRGNVGKKHEQS